MNFSAYMIDLYYSVFTNQTGHTNLLTNTIIINLIINNIFYIDL